MKDRAVFWDFDGVWSKDFFYKSFSKDYPKVWEFIQTKVWGQNTENRVNKWMKGELTMHDINRFISNETGINFDLLTKSFLDDIARMEIETRHLSIIEKLKQKGVKVGMITNNMDVFTTITVPRLDLLKLFDNRVFNSFDYRLLKAEGLYDIAMNQVGIFDYSAAIMIDDSQKARSAFEARGGKTYAYTTFEDFQVWAIENLLSQ